MKTFKISHRITSRNSDSVDKYLRDVSKIEMITPEEEVELSNRIKKGDVKALEKLVNANLRFVISVAKQYQNQGLSLPDLISEGNIGLIKAAKRFDATKGFKFISYAVWWIRQTILQALAENARLVRIPVNKVGNVNKLNNTLSKLTQDFEREPTPEELAKELEMEEEEIKELLNLSDRTSYLDEPVSNTQDAQTLLEIIPIKDEEKEKKEITNEKISELLSVLNTREREIIEYYYGIGKSHKYTLDEIAEHLGLTRERIRQIKTRAMNKLRSRAMNL